MKLISKFQEGGAMAPQGGAPAPQGGEDPMAMLLQGAQQAIEGQDCQVAMQVQRRTSCKTNRRLIKF